MDDSEDSLSSSSIEGDDFIDIAIEAHYQELSELFFQINLSREQRNKKSAPCKFYMMGKCKKQEFCTYSHDEILTGSSEVASTEAKPRTSLQINKPLVPCIFFEKGTCRNGYACRFLHLNSSIEVKEEDDLSCCICYELIVQEQKTFGILSDCDHVFCLDCIKAWRNQNEDQSRTCPICRKCSYYVIPSKVFLCGERKNEYANLYKSKLKNIPCKYYSKFEVCPFGDHCFYKHESTL